MKIDGYDPKGKRTSVQIDDHVFAYLMYYLDSVQEAKDFVRVSMRGHSYSKEGATLSKSVMRDCLALIVKPSLRRQFLDRDYQMDIEDY